MFASKWKRLSAWVVWLIQVSNTGDINFRYGRNDRLSFLAALLLGMR